MYACGQGLIYYLDGDPSGSWELKRSVGQLAGYSAEIRIPESEAALAIAQRSTVFYLPKKSNPNEHLFPLAVLQAFFSKMGVRLRDAGTVSDAIASASPPPNGRNAWWASWSGGKPCLDWVQPHGFIWRRESVTSRAHRTSLDEIRRLCQPSQDAEGRGRATCPCRTASEVQESS
jgi:hypothetical protein